MALDNRRTSWVEIIAQETDPVWTIRSRGEECKLTFPQSLQRVECKTDWRQTKIGKLAAFRDSFFGMQRIALIGGNNAGKSSVTRLFLQPENRPRVLVGPHDDHWTQRCCVWAPGDWREHELQLIEMVRTIFGAEPEPLALAQTDAHAQYNDVTKLSIPLLAYDEELNFVLFDCFDHTSAKKESERLVTIANVAKLSSALIVVATAETIRSDNANLLKQSTDLFRANAQRRAMVINKIEDTDLAKFEATARKNFPALDDVLFSPHGLFQDELQLPKAVKDTYAAKGLLSNKAPAPFREDLESGPQSIFDVVNSWNLTDSEMTHLKSRMSDELNDAEQSLTGEQRDVVNSHIRLASEDLEKDLRKSWRTWIDAEEIVPGDLQLVKDITEEITKQSGWARRIFKAYRGAVQKIVSSGISGVKNIVALLKDAAPLPIRRFIPEIKFSDTKSNSYEENQERRYSELSRILSAVLEQWAYRHEIEINNNELVGEQRLKQLLIESMSLDRENKLDPDTISRIVIDLSDDFQRSDYFQIALAGAIAAAGGFFVGSMLVAAPGVEVVVAEGFTSTTTAVTSGAGTIIAGVTIAGAAIGSPTVLFTTYEFGKALGLSGETAERAALKVRDITLEQRLETFLRRLRYELDLHVSDPESLSSPKRELPIPVQSIMTQLGGSKADRRAEPWVWTVQSDVSGVTGKIRQEIGIDG